LNWSIREKFIGRFRNLTKLKYSAGSCNIPNTNTPLDRIIKLSWSLELRLDLEPRPKTNRTTEMRRKVAEAIPNNPASARENQSLFGFWRMGEFI
jgi:hypothetical protein